MLVGGETKRTLRPRYFPERLARYSSIGCHVDRTPTSINDGNPGSTLVIRLVKRDQQGEDTTANSRLYHRLSARSEGSSEDSPLPL